MAGKLDDIKQINFQWSAETKDSVWTEIIRAKIRGQRDVLLHWHLPQAQMLTGYLAQLQIGDITNREGHAAKVYFNALFGPEFTRALPSPINAALNYGYGLILSAINREIVAAGYLTQLGIFHDNGSNAYNLGCDLMEPLRPIIDHEVMKMQPAQFEKDEKWDFLLFACLFVFCFDPLPENHHLALFALLHFAASLLALLEGEIFAGATEQHLIEQGIMISGPPSVPR